LDNEVFRHRAVGIVLRGESLREQNHDGPQCENRKKAAESAGQQRGAPNRAPPPRPPQRGARNSTWPTPLAGRGQALPSWDTRAFRLRVAVSWRAAQTHASLQIVDGLAGPRQGGSFLLVVTGNPGPAPCQATRCSLTIPVLLAKQKSPWHHWCQGLQSSN